MPDNSERKVSVIDAVLMNGKLKPNENRSSFVSSQRMTIASTKP